MAKKLIFICGPNGVGKSSTGRELINYLDNSAFVDSDLCALRNPFLDKEGINLGRQFMQFMLTKYLESSNYNKIIWSFGFHGHRMENFKNIMVELRSLEIDFDFIPIILTCDLDENIKRMKNDNRDDARIERAIVNTRELYNKYSFPTINTTNLTIIETVHEVIRVIEDTPVPSDEKLL